MHKLLAVGVLALLLHAEPAPPISKGQVTVVVFFSARCTVSNAYGDRFEAIYKEYAPRGVQFLFVNPNVNETDSEIAENARRHAFPFPVYHDVASETAVRLGAVSTPQVFVLDRDAAIQYRGAVDDAMNPARVKTQSLRLALDAVLAGRAVTTPVTRALGCAIKKPR